MDLSATLIALLGDPIALSAVKGEIVEPMVRGLAAKGLIDPQDVGTLVEAVEIGVSKFLPRLLAAGQTLPPH